MAHAHHFLSRLDRVSLPHVELALGLYRDEPMLQFVLGQVRLPEGAPRVAISLADPTEGPFLVVTREGRFVTCLGEGMRAGDLPVITRGQLDGIAARAGDLRNRVEAARRAMGPKGGAGKLLERVYSAGAGLCREDFIAASALQPLMERDLLVRFFGAVTSLEDARKDLLHVEKAKAVMRPRLRAYWNMLWAASHLSVLSLMNPRDLFVAFQGMSEELLKSSLSWGAVRQGVVGVALRGFWGVAKAGKLVVGGCKARYEEAASPLQTFDSGGGLLAIAHRHSKLRAEIGKVLLANREPEDPTTRDPEQRASDATAAVYREAYRMSVERPEKLAAFHRKAGADYAVMLTSELPKGSPYRFERQEDVPDEIAFGIFASHRGTFLDQPKLLTVIAVCLPWLARAKPEDLYLPRAFLQATHGAVWVPNETMRVVGAMRKYYGFDKPNPVILPEGPSRKGPCPCGSGKKYKRCCEPEGRPQVSEGFSSELEP